MSQYTEGTYVKGDDTRYAKDAKAAVALVFRGFKKVEESEAPAVEETKTEGDKPAAPAVPRPPLFTTSEENSKR